MRSAAVEIMMNVCIRVGGRPSEIGMLEPSLPPDVHTDFAEICTLQGWCLNPHISKRMRWFIRTRRNGWRYPLRQHFRLQ